VPPWLVGLGASVVGGVLVGVAATFGTLYAAAAAVALLFGVALLVWPTAAALLLPLISAVSGLRRGFPVHGLRLSEMLAVLCPAVIFVAVPRLRRVRWNALDWCALAYTILMVAIPVYKAHENGALSGSELMTLVGPAEFFLIYRATVLAGLTPSLRVRMLRWFLLSSIVANVLAAAQAANVPGIRSFIATATGVNAYVSQGYVGFPRATGPFPIWHVLAGYDVIIAVLAIALWLSGDRKVLRTWVLGLVAVLAVVGIVVSVTATSAIGVILAILLLGGVSGRLGRILGVGVPVGAVLGVLFWPLISARVASQGVGGSGGGSGTPQTLSFRWEVWTQQYIPAIRASPLTGYGDQLPDRINWQYSESIYFSLLLRGGLVLFAAYLVWTLAMLVVSRDVAKMRDLEPFDLAVGRTTYILVLVLLPMQILFPYLLNSGIPHALWLLLGLTNRTWITRKAPDDGGRLFATSDA
jgi:hypothetical protein